MTAPTTTPLSGKRTGRGTSAATTSHTAQAPATIAITRSIRSGLHECVCDVTECRRDRRLQLVGRFFRSAHRARNLEHDQQRGQREEVTDRREAVELEGEANG